MGRKKFFDRINGLIFLGKWKKTPRCFEASLKKVGLSRFKSVYSTGWSAWIENIRLIISR